MLHMMLQREVFPKGGLALATTLKSVLDNTDTKTQLSDLTRDQ